MARRAHVQPVDLGRVQRHARVDAGRCVDRLSSCRVGFDPVIAMQRIDGSDAPHTIVPATKMPYSARFSPDGKWVVYRTADYGSVAERIYAINLAHPDSVMSLSTATGFEFSPEPSPDSKWLATTSLSTGRGEVFVRLSRSRPAGMRSR